MIEVHTYNLPDSILIDPLAVDNAWHFWHPDGLYIVLGQSNKIERSLILERVSADQITVYKRPSGGESVILSDKTLVIAVRLISEKLENPKTYFIKINTAIIRALEDAGVHNISHKGISDIAIGEKKILGSSIYRKKNIVFYHAVLNVSEDISLIGKYLQHPSKEPDYRKGRNHGDFVTSILKAGYVVDIDDLVSKLELQFSRSLGS